MLKSIRKCICVGCVASVVALSACGSGTAPDQASAPQTSEQVRVAAQIQRLRFPVTGMVCEGCENSIRGAIEKLDGVVSCTASHTGQDAVIAFDQSRITREILSQTIAKLGYQVGTPEEATLAPGTLSNSGDSAQASEN